MATFPGIQYSERTPSGRTGAVPLPMQVDTGAQAIAQGIMNVGLAFGEIGRKAKQAQDAMRLSAVNREHDELANFYSDAIGKTRDAEEAEKLIVEFKTKAGSLAEKDSPEVQNAYKINFNNSVGSSESALRKMATAGWAKGALDTYKFERQKAAEAGDRAKYLKITTLAKAADLIGPAEYDREVEGMETTIAFAQAGLIIDTKPREAVAQLSAMTGLSPDQLQYKNQLIGLANKQMGTLAGEANKQLTDLYASGKLTLPAIQANRNSLDDTDYLAWTKIAMQPADKRGNAIQEAGFKSAAMDVWRGALTRDEFDKRIRESLADPDGINEDQYVRVAAAADTQLEKTQAEDIRRFSRDAANVILGQYSGLMQFDAMGNLSGINLAGLSGDQIEDTKYRMHYLSIYEQGLRDWIAKNPTASGREFAVFAAEQKMRYWNTTPEQMKAQAKAQGKGKTVSTWQKGDTRVVNGTTYTYDGSRWND